MDEKTQVQKSGVSLEYLLTSDLRPVVNQDGSKGYRHIKESVPVEMFSRVKSVPAVYKVNFAMSVSKGKPSMKISDLEYVGEIKK